MKDNPQNSNGQGDGGKGEHITTTGSNERNDARLIARAIVRSTRWPTEELPAELQKQRDESLKKMAAATAAELMNMPGERNKRAGARLVTIMEAQNQRDELGAEPEQPQVTINILADLRQTLEEVRANKPLIERYYAERRTGDDRGEPGPNGLGS